MQVPQYLLEAASEAGQGAQCNIICTQPRRIAAISVAERVAAERGESAPGTQGRPPLVPCVGLHITLAIGLGLDLQFRHTHSDSLEGTI